MITHDQFREALQIVNEYKKQLYIQHKELNIKVKEVNELTSSVSKFVNINQESLLDDIGISTRLLTVLRRHFKYLTEDENLSWFDIKVKHLSEYTIHDFMKFRGIGKDSIQEIIEIFYYAGLDLKKGNNTQFF